MHAPVDPSSRGAALVGLCAPEAAESPSLLAPIGRGAGGLLGKRS